MNAKDFGVDTTTGIRFGVIHAEYVKFWREESDALYDVDLVDEVNQIYPTNPSLRVLESIGYEAHQDEFGVIVVTHSPYFTYGKRIGPNMPGMVKMNTSGATTEDEKCYCFGEEFYDRYKIPHDIYEVATGKLVHKNNWVKS